MIHTSADLDYAIDLVCDEDALHAGQRALATGSPLVVDVRMLAAGITSRQCVVALDLAPTLVPGLTRSAAGIRAAAAEHPEGVKVADGFDTDEAVTQVGTDLRQLLDRSMTTRRRVQALAPEADADEAALGARYADPALELVLPVGHFAGPMYTSPTATAPESFEIRFRDGVFSLSAQEYAVWAVSHGDPQRVGRQPVTRQVVADAARSAGVQHPEPLLDSLLKDKLLTTTGLHGGAARDFAQRHQLRPLALGLGNTANQLGGFQIGLPNTPRATVGYDIYHIWLFGHQSPTLWESLTAIAAEAAEANVEEQTVLDGVRLIEDPDALLSGIMQALPILLSTSCVYLDRVD